MESIPTDLQTLRGTTNLSTRLPFIENDWYAVAFGNELGRGLIERTVLDRPIVLFRTRAGDVTMLDGLCPHRQYPLVLGTIIGDAIECGYHGLQFDCDGACVRIPGQERIPPALRIRRYPTVERGGWVWAWLGELERADESQIAEVWLGEPGWTSVGGSRDVAARSQLILENLMDLSHESFIHPTSIGNSHVAETPIETEVAGNIVRGRRFMKGVPAAPSHARFGAISPVDRE